MVPNTTRASCADELITCSCCSGQRFVEYYGSCPLCDGLGHVGVTINLPRKEVFIDKLTRAASFPDPTGAPNGPAILPEVGARNVLITAALPYVNNVPHLGNIIGCVLSADVYARYCRSRGYKTVYIGGTDEYGTATEAKALQEGLTPREICNKYHALHKEAYKWFGISFDHFGRTSEPKQTEIVQSIFRKVLSNGWLKEDSIQQLYSERLDKFLADRFVEGTCPKCHYIDARGDQCDKCGTLLNPTDLLEPRCKFTGETPVLRTTRHLFLDLPQLEHKLSSFVDQTSCRGGWTSNAKQVTAAWLRDGLKPRCITRDLKWGVPVPHAGFEDKVFYVWFDAPIGYISITADYTHEWERWWRAPDDVELVQFLGKDNIPFHTVIFPASLLATGQQWTLLERISVTEYLNYEDGKFSKSRGVGVFGNDVESTGIHADIWRYYLISVRPEHSDTEFRWDDFAARNNNELLKNLGNFCHRVLDFAAARYSSVVPQVSSNGGEDCVKLGAELVSAVNLYIEHLEKTKLRDGLRAALSVSTIGNAFLTACEPWKHAKTDPDRANTHIVAALGVVRLLAVLLSPFLPTVSGIYLHFLGLDVVDGRLCSALLAGIAAPQTLLAPGHRLGPRSRPVFKEISATEVQALRSRFSGLQHTSALVGGA